jgi:hypothetical protein
MTVNPPRNAMGITFGHSPLQAPQVQGANSPEIAAGIL